MKLRSRSWIMASELRHNADREGTVPLELRLNQELDLRNLSLEGFRMLQKSLDFW